MPEVSPSRSLAMQQRQDETDPLNRLKRTLRTYNFTRNRQGALHLRHDNSVQVTKIASEVMLATPLRRGMTTTVWVSLAPTDNRHLIRVTLEPEPPEFARLFPKD